MPFEVTRVYDPAEIEARCVVGCGKGPWRDNNNNWPVGMAKRHTKSTGHETEVWTVSVAHFTAAREVD